MTDLEARWRRALLPKTATLTETIENLNAVGIRLVLCVHADGRLYGSVTDGDLRRGLLRGLSMEDAVSEIANPNPLVVPEGTDREIVRALMVANKVQQVPVVDPAGRPVGLHLWDTLDTPPERDNVMVIMAGGKGTRLRPYTESCPKPMLPVAGKPLLQHIVERARSQGISRFVISLNYLGQMIRDHFGDGAALGVRIDYVTEDAPLGTAGALALLDPRPELPFLVTNGDVLTDIDYGEVLEFRARHEAAAVMAVRVYEWANPFGVVEMDGVDIAGFVEKPVIRSHINAGIYAFLPDALDHLERNSPCDMPTLFDRLREAGRRTVAFPMHEPWLDVGRPDDLTLARASLEDEA
ncbi:CBS domain-containing protein [Rhodovulum sp. ES.010]|uniref:nucleotidyltransferase family protein n=1 Tax=Rhodovulum sp. ES.010 TaxID=1882821 RepID=UPI0009260390|nr:nucleotidyltransferase family protein [Rhodovulum sp. ES.010]SIO45842.1 CBS domain-containing protein [Rhodovulum sp. ES.010]